MKTQAAIVVDFRHVRCEFCKVELRSDLATECSVCGAEFNEIVTNHVGLDERLRRKRELAGVPTYTECVAN